MSDFLSHDVVFILVEPVSIDFLSGKVVQMNRFNDLNFITELDGSFV